MITWLQALIEKRGKWLFIILLAVVIVSFVPYISPTGSSSLDFFSEESQRGQDQYFGYDWYNPNDQRLLTVSYQASTSMGTSIVPEEEVVIVAAEKFRQSLPGMAQAAFQAGQQEQAQELFGLWQQWGGIPLEQKARIIANMPSSSSEFTRGVMEAKIALLQIGASWELLPLALENGDIVKAFRKFLAARVDNRLGITQDGELDPAKFELVVNLYQLPRGARPVFFFSFGRDIWIIELSLEPTCRGRLSSLGALYLDTQPTARRARRKFSP